MAVKTDLPMIVRFTDMYDGGPCDDGATATCPHCGSDGRYIFFFECEDGTERGAMRGCLKLFPVSKIAEIDRKLIEKEAELAKKYGREAHLNSWQTAQREAIDAFYAGSISQEEALRTIDREQRKMVEYRARKNRGRW